MFLQIFCFSYGNCAMTLFPSGPFYCLIILCPICNQGSEDMFHALFFFPCAKDVWSFCLHKSVTLRDRDNLYSWMKEFISNIGPIGPIIMWKIFCSQNKCIFENIKHSVSSIIISASYLESFCSCYLSQCSAACTSRQLATS